MSSIKTFDGDKRTDPLLSFQCEGVSRMRTALLSCSQDNVVSARSAMQQVTVLRVYHQVSRIVRFLDLMDKLEAKLYDSIEATVDTADIYDNSTWISLLAIQKQLQQNLIESQKLLQPFLDSNIFDIPVEDISIEENSAKLISPESRENIRNAAQAVLVELNAG